MHNLSTAAAMFELGASLRAARHKRGLELDAVQRELRIRKRYLEALEGERFELLPGQVYARGFLREYAEFLGLDGSIYLDEYNARFAHHDEQPIAALPTVPRRRRAPAAPLVVSLLAAVAVAVGLAAWKLGGSGTTPPAAAPHARAPAAKRPAAVLPSPIPAVAKPAAKPRVAQLLLEASRGDCWVIVRDGSPSGRVLYENTIRRGATVRLSARGPLWMRVGAGTNLNAWLGGKALHGIPYMTGNLVIGA